MHRGQTIGERTHLACWAGRRLAAAIFLMIAAAAVIGCGEATEQPEDCRPGEYFNEANESCDACPALRQPQCREGCGFVVITPDDRDALRCPVAECAEPCLCQEQPGQYFEEDTLSCESCETAADPPALCAERTNGS